MFESVLVALALKHAAALACVALFGAGHMIRDGWPTLGTTHGARALGAFVCGLGSVLVCALAGDYALGLGVWLAVWSGYYIDMKHGEGQGPDDTLAHTLHNEIFLPLSGVTSVMALAGVEAWLHHDPRYLFVLAIGLAKTLIWPAAWNSVSVAKDGWFFEPTRIAAIEFGMVQGAFVAVFA